MCVPPVGQALASSTSRSRSVTTTKFHGCQFDAEGARRPASRTRSSSSRGIGWSVYWRTLRRARMASHVSMPTVLAAPGRFRGLVVRGWCAPSVLLVRVGAAAGRPGGQPLDGPLEVRVEVDEGLQLVGQPGEGPLLLAPPVGQLLQAPIGEVHRSVGEGLGDQLTLLDVVHL